jgi:hypothetical protein
MSYQLAHVIPDQLAHVTPDQLAHVMPIHLEHVMSGQFAHVMPGLTRHPVSPDGPRIKSGVTIDEINRGVTAYWIKSGVKRVG